MSIGTTRLWNNCGTKYATIPIRGWSKSAKRGVHLETWNYVRARCAGALHLGPMVPCRGPSQFRFGLRNVPGDRPTAIPVVACALIDPRPPCEPRRGLDAWARSRSRTTRIARIRPVHGAAPGWGESSERRASRVGATSVRGRGPCPPPRGRERPVEGREVNAAKRTSSRYVGTVLRNRVRACGTTGHEDWRTTRAVCRIPCIHGTRRPHPHELTAH